MPSNLMDLASTMKIMTVREPMVSYNRCQLGVPYEQSDSLDKMISMDKYSAECITNKHQCYKFDDDERFIDQFIYSK